MYDKKDKGKRESTDQNIFGSALTNCKMYERKPSNLKANFHSSQSTTQSQKFKFSALRIEN